MGQALYRKYRSKSLQEIVGQEHITRTLSQALQQGRISHAYLFTGPRGVGKTSIARILAHEINGIPYAEGQTNLDIIEIDAASNRRIDEIRDLRDKVYVAPANAKYKVYIIDEVHMLTREAFNALLKTLEEPPAHVVFILATTEAHKLPETIISRTQRYIFRPINPSDAVTHLRTIAKEEHIDITDDALALIAEHGDGSFRDSISLLDQANNHGAAIDLAVVQTMLGIPPEQAIRELAGALDSADSRAQKIIGQLTALYDQGFQAAAVAKQLASTTRDAIINGNTTANSVAATQLLAKLLDVPTSRDPERYLEIVLLEQLPQTVSQPVLAVEPIKQPVVSQVASQQPIDNSATDTKPVAEVTPKPHKRPTPAPKQDVSQKPESSDPETPAKHLEAPAAPTTRSQAEAVVDTAVWQQLLNALKKQHNTLYGIARMAQPDFSQPGIITLSFAFAFHQKRLNEAKNQQIISDALAVITGETIEINCVHDDSLKTKVPAAALPTSDKPAGDPSLSAISNIFGGGELLQS